jgi:hypothetical protein
MTTSSSGPAVAFAKDVRAYVLDYIKVSDAKAGAVSTGVALVGAAVGSIAEKTLRGAHAQSPRSLVLVLVVLLLIVSSVVLTVIYTISTLLPRTPTAAGSLASFPDISKDQQATYVEKVCSLDEPSVAAEYAAHAWTLSHIALSKFGSLKKALRWFTLAVLGTVLFVGLRVWTARESSEQETTNVRILPQGK